MNRHQMNAASGHRISRPSSRNQVHVKPLVMSVSSSTTQQASDEHGPIRVCREDFNYLKDLLQVPPWRMEWIHRYSKKPTIDL